MTMEEYDTLLEKQGGVCAVCGTDDTTYSKGNHFHVDHNHTTGKVRGLLCGHCNLAIGQVKEDPQIIHNMISYLEKYKG